MKEFEQRPKMESAYMLKGKIDAEETRRFVHPILSSTGCYFAQSYWRPRRTKLMRYPRLDRQHEFVTILNDGQYLHPSIPLARVGNRADVGTGSGFVVSYPTYYLDFHFQLF